MWLIKIAQHWVRGQKPATLKRLVSDVRDVFNGWKLTLADAKGMIELAVDGAGKPFKTDGALTVTGSRRKFRVSELTACQCADPKITSDLDLAFQLDVDKYPPFIRLIDEYSFPLVLAIVGTLASKSASRRSLILLNSILGTHLSLEARNATMLTELFRSVTPRLERADRMAAPLQAGRKTSAKVRRERAAASDKAIKTMAFDYWRNHPSASEEDVVSYIGRQIDGTNIRLAPTTIAKKIKGQKRAALKSVDTDITK